MSEESDLLATISSLLASDTEAEPQKEETQTVSSDSSFDLGMMIKLGSMLSDFNQEDERMKLLYDLKPFLSDARRDKIDSAVKILRLLKIAEKAKNENLF